MRKAEKRRLGREKFEKDLAESKQHGLRMQELDRKRREQQMKDTLVQRDVKNLQHVQSKVSKAEKARNKKFADDLIHELDARGLIDHTMDDVLESNGVG